MPEQAKTIYANCLGLFVFDEQHKMIDKELFDTDAALKFLTTKELSQNKIVKKYSGAKIIGSEELPHAKVIEAFRNEEFFRQFYDVNILFAKQRIKQSFTKDQLIVQSVAVIEDLEKVANSLVKRLRDWYSITQPEIAHSIEDHERLVKSILEKDPNDILRELNIKESLMGADISGADMQQIKELAKQVNEIYQLRQNQTRYIESLMKELCPNVNAITGTLIGAKLVALAGSLMKLSQFPASTVQLLGAEKALFRHMRTGAKPPKFGVLMMHPLLAKVKKADRGKVARALADKVSIAAKVDYFKGEFIGDRLRQELEKKFRA